MIQDKDTKLSIIVVTWRVKDLLENCLNSILSNLSRGKIEVIVVDNNSQDGSVEILKEHYPQIRLFENQENVGFGKACNKGIEIAQGRFLFILNPDTLVEVHTLQRITDFMESNPQVGIGGCYVYYPDGKLQTSFYKFPTMLSYLSRVLSLFRILPRNKLTQKFFWEYLDNDVSGSVERVLGGAMVLRKEMVEQIGAFDEAYFLYSEELDLCYRARLMGWQVATIPGTEVVHYHQQSTLQNIRQATFHTFRSDYLFFRKFYPFHKTILLRVMQFWGILFRLLAWGGMYLFASSQKALAKEKSSGYLRLLLSNFDYSKSLAE